MPEIEPKKDQAIDVVKHNDAYRARFAFRVEHAKYRSLVQETEKGVGLTEAFLDYIDTAILPPVIPLATISLPDQNPYPYEKKKYISIPISGAVFYPQDHMVYRVHQEGSLVAKEERGLLPQKKKKLKHTPTSTWIQEQRAMHGQHDNTDYESQHSVILPSGLTVHYYEAGFEKGRLTPEEMQIIIDQIPTNVQNKERERFEQIKRTYQQRIDERAPTYHAGIQALFRNFLLTISKEGRLKTTLAEPYQITDEGENLFLFPQTGNIYHVENKQGLTFIQKLLAGKNARDFANPQIISQDDYIRIASSLVEKFGAEVAV